MNHRKLSAGETAGTYRITDAVTEAELLGIAQAFAKRRLARGRKITQPALAFEYLQLLLQDYEHEEFSAVFLDSQHRVISFEELFRGTIDSASVYPREVVTQAQACNAAAVILVHSHPSGDPDRRITQQLKGELGLVGFRAIDHIVISTQGYSSVAQRGYI